MKVLPISRPMAGRHGDVAAAMKTTDDLLKKTYPLTGNFLAGRLREKLDSDDLSCLESLVVDERNVRDQETFVERGEMTDTCAMLVEGMMFSTIRSDHRRFIVGVHVPGDCVDLHGFAVGRLDHSLVAVGEARVAIIPHAGIEQVIVERPRLARAMWFATLLDAAIYRKWIQMHEQLDAPQRIAHIYCELQARLELIGHPRARVLRLPFTQLDLADMCGISAVHANRAVSRLRESGLGEIRRGTLYVGDWDALREYAQFEPGYLYGEGPLKMNEVWD